MPIDESRTFLPVNIAVLTVSDTRTVRVNLVGKFGSVCQHNRTVGQHLCEPAHHRELA